MGKILDWGKLNLKDGANIAELEELERTLTFEGVTDKNKALEIIKKDGTVFRSALDFAVTEAVKSHDEKFTTDKLPGLIKTEREKIQKELNPELTPAQKELADLKDWKVSQEAKDLRNTLEKSLREKGKELKYLGDDAESFSIYGDKAMEILESKAKKMETLVSSGVESRIKELYGDNKPPQKNKADGVKVITRADYDNMEPKLRSTFFSEGGKVVDN